MKLREGELRGEARSPKQALRGRKSYAPRAGLQSPSEAPEAAGASRAFVNRAGRRRAAIAFPREDG